MTDMASVRSRVNGYSLCAESFTVDSHLLNTWAVLTARIAQSGHFIYIYT